MTSTTPPLTAVCVQRASSGPAKSSATVRRSGSALGIGALERAQAARQQRVLGELARHLEEGWAVAAGPQEVIDALRDGQVADLILGPDPGATASRCSGCRSLFAAARESCPYCAAPCHKANLWQEVLAQALAHGIWVDLVDGPSDLDRHGGIAALLVRDEPQWTPRPESATREGEETAP